MKRSGYIILSIALFVSLVFHFTLFRLVHYEKESKEGKTERYQVNLIYYESPETPSEKPIVKKKNRPKKAVEKKKEQKENKAEPEQQPMRNEADAFEKHPDQIQDEAPAEAERQGVTPETILLQEPKPAETIALEQPDYTSVLSGLRDELLKRKVYPYGARKKGFEGVVVVFVRLDTEGRPLEIKMARSSGYRVLDTAAVSLVKKALPYRHNTGHDISFEIPIKYSLVE